MKITSIYRWWKRNTSSPLVPNFSPWFDPKILQPLLQRSNDELPVLCRKMVGRVGHFGAVPPPLQPRSATTIYTRVYSGVRVSFSCRFHLIWGRNEASNEHEAANDPNAWNPSIHNPRRTFLDSTEKCGLLKCFHASPSEGCTITPSTAWCDWCHVMCSAVLSDMNNLCSLGVIGKYLSFLYATRVFPLPVLGL